MVKIDLRNWKPVDATGDAGIPAPGPIDRTPVDPPRVVDVRDEIRHAPEEIGDNPIMDELQEEVEDDVPQAELIFPYPIMLVTAQAVVNENGKGKAGAEVYELDLKMRVPASDLAYILGKVEGHKSAVIFRPLSEVV